jgi:hypothetical protein
LALLFSFWPAVRAVFSKSQIKKQVQARPSDELEFAVDTIEPQPSTEIKVEEQKVAEQKYA